MMSGDNLCIYPESWKVVKLGSFVQREEGKKPKEKERGSLGINEKFLSGLPIGWQFAKLHEVVEVNPRPDKSTYIDSLAVSFVPMPAVEAGTGIIDVSYTRPLYEVGKGYTHFQEGDVLFAKITPCMENGKMAVVPPLENGLGFGSTEFHVLRPYREISAQYIFYFVSSEHFRRSAQHNMTGAVGQRRVPPTYLANQYIPVPSPPEQHRIVTKIEELFSELDKGVESLKKARKQLKVYRQAVLKHAFEGKLTAKWREEYQDKLEKPEQLLARIKCEREARYEQQFKEWKAAAKKWKKVGQQGIKPKSPLKPKVLEPLSKSDFANLPSLPFGWLWVRLGNIGLVGTGVTPLKSNLAHYSGGEIPWVTSGMLNESYVHLCSNFVTEKALNDTSLRLYPPHTLVVALYGEGKTRGKCSELLIHATTNQAVAAIVQEGSASGLRGFLKWFLTKNYEAIRLNSSGGVQPNLNLGIIENTTVPLCSIAEAKEIEKRIEKQCSVLDHLEAVVESEIQKSVALRQATLKKAFSGELVVQDPHDEPASMLLARICVAKSA